MQHSETAFQEQAAPARAHPASARREHELSFASERPHARAPRGGYRTPHWEQANQEARVRKVLVATNFSPPSAKAVEQAAALADQCHAALTILHVIDINAQPAAGRSGRATDLMKDRWAEGAAQMRQVAESLSGRVEAQTALEEGLPWEQLVERSAEFDLLVLGRSRTKKAWKVFSRHTAQRVMDHAACPVLVVQPQA